MIKAKKYMRCGFAAMYSLRYCSTLSRPKYAWNICRWTLINQKPKAKSSCFLVVILALY